MRPTNNIIGVIPARLESTRLARKALVPIAGVPMIERVYRGARESRRLQELLVATDSAEIARFCESVSIPFAMTSPAHNSGTDRVIEVVMSRGADAAVNIQGDEPMVNGAMVDALVEALFSNAAIEVATLATRIDAGSAAASSNTKVVTDKNGRALYFSRAVIPFSRDGGSAPNYFKHLGYYAYSRRALELFRDWPITELETIERLEQLRFLYNGVDIAVAEVERDTIGIDTAEDLERAERFFRSRNNVER